LIYNGDNLPGTLDTVTFNGSNVLGNVGIDNADGNTSVTVNNSTLGSHLVASPFSPVIGGSLQIENDAGFDQFSMTDSTVPWGILINNDVSGNNDVWGSATNIAGSHRNGALRPFDRRVPRGSDGPARRQRPRCGQRRQHRPGRHAGSTVVQRQQRGELDQRQRA
jgi:hypothetical protein